MFKHINLTEVHDRYAPNENYTRMKAQSAATQRPGVYKVEGDILTVDTSKTNLTIEQIIARLHWGYQWNDI